MLYIVLQETRFLALSPLKILFACILLDNLSHSIARDSIMLHQFHYQCIQGCSISCNHFLCVFVGFVEDFFHSLVCFMLNGRRDESGDNLSQSSGTLPAFVHNTCDQHENES